MAEYIANVDIAADCQLSDFFHILDTYSARLLTYVAEGPGGGNPSVDLSFPTQEHYVAFMNVYYNNAFVSVPFIK